MPNSALYSESLTTMAARLEQVEQNKHTTKGSLLRLEVRMPTLDLTRWLQVQPFRTRCFWADREGDCRVAGLGVAEQYQANSIDEVAILLDVLSQRTASVKSNTAARYYGGIAFNGSVTGIWSDFGYSRFVLPRLEIVMNRNNSWLICNLRNSPEEFAQARDALNQLIFSEQLSSEQPSSEPLPEFSPVKPTCLSLEPSRNQWRHQVNQVLSAIDAGQLDKAVLSRRSTLSFNAPIDAWCLLGRWRATQIASYQFGFQFNNSPCYIGCSPERLFRRTGRLIATEALAGTMACTTDPEKNDRLAKRLLGDKKNLHENALVLKDIRQRLQPLCSDLIDDGDHTVLRLRNLQHLRYAFRGVLKPEVTDGQLLQTLHPTPAVGGYPRQAAVDLIRQLETYARGWYSGACGYVGADQSEFTVAIRSGLVDNNTIHLFSGAGLVEGSDPDMEWNELNAKIRTPREVLGLKDETDFSLVSKQKMSGTHYERPKHQTVLAGAK